jgi:hypothetical protein
MKQSIIKKIILLAIGLVTSVCYGQLLPPDLMPKDTLSFRYHFVPGDTLTYVAMSTDSISIDYGSPLLRIRFEKYVITCDSITHDGYYSITQRLTDFRSKESYEETKDVERTSSAWLDMPVTLIIDTLGHRIRHTYPKPIPMATAPGGAFQPILILPLDSIGLNRRYTSEAWLLENEEEDIPENGMPIPFMRYVLYYHLIGMVDTLDFKNLMKFTFSMTSQASVVVKDSSVDMRTVSVSNGSGEIFFDTMYWVPKVYTQTMQQKLTIEDKKNNASSPGSHWINTTFILDKIVRKKQ